MSDQTPLPPPSDGGDPGDPGPDVMLAGEYALGVLDAEDRAAAEARADREPDFAREVLSWAVRLAPLLDEVRPADPDVALWPRIEAALPAPTTAARVVAQTRAQATPAPVAPIDPPRPANVNLNLWRGIAAAATAVAAVALIFIAVRPSTGVAPVPANLPGGGAGTLVAALDLSNGGARTLTVAYDPAKSDLFTVPDAGFSVPKARSAELWLIPADGKPRPIGVVDAAKPAALPMPARYRALARAKDALALSIEPVGGSPTGAPTGPVIATGALTAI